MKMVPSGFVQNAPTCSAICFGSSSLAAQLRHNQTLQCTGRASSVPIRMRVGWRATVDRTLVRQAYEGFAVKEPKTSELEAARGAIASLISKSAKAQRKLTPGTWQHSMLRDNLKALRFASALMNNE